MRLVGIDDLKPDMELARNIYNADGRILLNSGVKLSDSYIDRLKTLGLSSLYVKDEFSPDDDSYPDIISEHSRIETMSTVKKSFHNLQNNRKLNVRMVQSTVNNLIDELLYNSDVLIGLKDIRVFDDYTFAHSVNVCILSLVTGITLSYNNIKLKELGIGALLHDIGKTKISKEILNKPDDLTEEEFNEMKNHPQYGFDILRQYPEISLLSAHIAYQHHERLDGTGYPRKLAAEDIHEYAKIVAVADVYDSLMADRPYRPSYTVNQALAILKRSAGSHLEGRIVNALAANIAVYPIGTLVELNTGNIGIVSDVNKEQPTRPIVRVIYDRKNKHNCPFLEIDLSKKSTILIVRELTSQEFKSMFER